MFVLKQSLELYDFYTKQVEACDAEITRLYGAVRPEWQAGELPTIPMKKRNSHSKNAPKNTKEIRQHLQRISGVDLSVVDGFGVSLAQTVIMEVGTDTPAPTAGTVCRSFRVRSISVRGWAWHPSMIFRVARS